MPSSKALWRLLLVSGAERDTSVVSSARAVQPIATRHPATANAALFIITFSRATNAPHVCHWHSAGVESSALFTRRFRRIWRQRRLTIRRHCPPNRYLSTVSKGDLFGTNREG